jgi:hypothetical protein
MVLKPAQFLCGNVIDSQVAAKPQRFTVVSNQTEHVDMDIDTGIR